MLQNVFNKGLALLSTLALVSGLALATPQLLPTSLADEEPDALEARVKSSADAYNNALARQEELANEIATLDSRIAELEEKLPTQKERSDESARALYKYTQDTGSVVMMLLDSKSITDMLAMADSYSWVIEYNTAEIQATMKMEEELKGSRSKLEADKVDADQAAAEALSTLNKAKQAREEAAARAAAAQAEEKQALQEVIDSPDASEEEKAAATEAAANVETTSSANVGWSDDKVTFVNQWAPRIDAYLSGSPMAGTGRDYAAAAWDNGVDPRWAPAISFVESSKGAACYRSYNAWGYGGFNFSSWKEGINRVCGSLGGSLYGGYLTRSAAQTYCPTNPEHWFNSCATQMAMI